MLCNNLLNYGWSQVYNNTSVATAVHSLNTAKHFAMDQSEKELKNTDGGQYALSENAMILLSLLVEKRNVQEQRRAALNTQLAF